MKHIRMAIGSDVFPTYGDIRLFEQGDVGALLGDLLPEWRRADFSFVNVESPLTKSTTPIPKIGPSLKASPECIRFYKTLPATAVGLANNHIQDFGAEGVMDTLKLFADAGISTVGGGRDACQARQPLVHRFPMGKTLGIMAMAEREFCIADEMLPGANPVDYVNCSTLAELRKQVDKVLVILHAGTECYQYPRPGLVELCHFLADQGASAVVVQHTHCVGCFEEYRGVPILYGQGNFIFRNRDPRSAMPTLWREGLHLNLVWDTESNELTMQFVPFEQDKDGPGISRLRGARLEGFLKDFRERSVVLKNGEDLLSRWREFCESQKEEAVLGLLGIAGIMRGVSRRLPIASLWLRSATPSLSRNWITCESHREMVVTVLENALKRMR